MILDLLNSVNTNTTTVQGFSVGTFTLDCQLEEAHESRLTTTDNPMESGALASDHSYLEPKRYAVRGLVTSYESFDYAGSLLDQSDLYGQVSGLPLPMAVTSAIDQAKAVVNRYANLLTQASSILAPWLPSSTGFFEGNTSQTNRYQQIYSDLLKIQANGERLTVTSGLMTYNNMKLMGVNCVSGVDDSVEISLEFKEENIVETRTVSGLVVNVPQAQTQKQAQQNTPAPVNATKTGRSADQSAKVKSKGKTQPKEVKESGIVAIVQEYKKMRGG